METKTSFIFVDVGFWEYKFVEYKYVSKLTVYKYIWLFQVVCL